MKRCNTCARNLESSLCNYRRVWNSAPPPHARSSTRFLVGPGWRSPANQGTAVGSQFALRRRYGASQSRVRRRTPCGAQAPIVLVAHPAWRTSVGTDPPGCITPSTRTRNSQRSPCRSKIQRHGMPGAYLTTLRTMPLGTTHFDLWLGFAPGKDVMGILAFKSANQRPYHRRHH
jgi:hypothetical protein